MDAANLHISPVVVHMIKKTFFHYIVIFPYFKCFQPFPFEKLIDDALFSVAKCYKRDIARQHHLVK